MVAQELVACRERIQKASTRTGVLGEEGLQRAFSFLNVLSVFETEIACQLRSWNRIPEVIQVPLPLTLE